MPVTELRIWGVTCIALMLLPRSPQLLIAQGRKVFTQGDVAHMLGPDVGLNVATVIASVSRLGCFDGSIGKLEEPPYTRLTRSQRDALRDGLQRVSCTVDQVVFDPLFPLPDTAVAGQAYPASVIPLTTDNIRLPRKQAEWATSNQDVAVIHSVGDGAQAVIQFQAAGSVRLSASIRGKSAVMEVSVVNPVRFGARKATLWVGSESQIAFESTGRGRLRFRSEGGAVRVDEYGRLRAVEPGQAQVIVWDEHGGVEDTMVVTVRERRPIATGTVGASGSRIASAPPTPPMMGCELGAPAGAVERAIAQLNEVGKGDAPRGGYREWPSWAVLLAEPTKGKRDVRFRRGAPRISPTSGATEWQVEVEHKGNSGAFKGIGQWNLLASCSSGSITFTLR